MEIGMAVTCNLGGRLGTSCFELDNGTEFWAEGSSTPEKATTGTWEANGKIESDFRRSNRRCSSHAIFKRAVTA